MYREASVRHAAIFLEPGTNLILATM